jgi:hypothetical protein
MAVAKRKTTIGSNPLDAVVPHPGRRPASISPKETPAASLEEKKVKERMTFHLPVDVMDRAKNAVYWTPGLTLADLAAEALGDAVDRLEKKRGEPFRPRTSELKGGRPMK